MTLMTLLIALAVLLVVGPLIAWLARRLGKRTRKGNPMMALALFGLGQPMDPPREHPSETADRERRGTSESGQGEL
jgi:hypothetical protein